MVTIIKIRLPGDSLSYGPLTGDFDCSKPVFLQTRHGGNNDNNMTHTQHTHTHGTIPSYAIYARREDDVF